MKKGLYICIAFFYFTYVLGCKKDAQKQPTPPQKETHSLEKGLIHFSINGELLGAAIDTVANTITAVVPDTANQHILTGSLELQNQVTAKLNTTSVANNFTFDFTGPVTLTVTSENKQRSTSFTVIIETQLQFEGFTGALIAQKSLNKSYDYYLDQFDGSEFASSNCGPAASTMAIKWADSTFNETPAHIRTLIEPQGGQWYTGDVQQYLKLNNIPYATDTLKNIDSLVKTNIGKNHVMILCLNMLGVSPNSNNYQHVSRFYGNEVVGHFILIKGYKQVGDTFYLEAYDPYSQNKHYPGYDYAQFMGKDRYYIDSQIETCVRGWWPYVIIVGPKGQHINSSPLKVSLQHKPLFQGKGQ
ncbi:MAG TPA: hypothetical protein VJ844_10055 [Mucilaginibacter sp.]|nr:hypothetical protein [Mucilaginibacter sp.]